MHQDEEPTRDPKQGDADDRNHSPAREPFSCQVSRATQDRARATVRGMRQATRGNYSLNALTEDALQRHCAELEDNYNDGKPWPQDPGRPLPPGRQG